MFPANAGMIPFTGSFPSGSFSVPRECGDDPIYDKIMGEGGVCSPLFPKMWIRHIVFPANAGMIPRRSISLERHTSVPRECGDDPWVSLGSQIITECSPRMRG